MEIRVKNNVTENKKKSLNELDKGLNMKKGILKWCLIMSYFIVAAEEIKV